MELSKESQTKKSTRPQRKASSEARRVPIAVDIADNYSDTSRVSKNSALIISELKEEHRKKVAELEHQLAQTRELVERVIDHKTIGTSPHIRDYLDNCVDEAKSLSRHSEHSANPEKPGSHVTTDELLGALRSLELPKVELSYFDGNPVNYIKFIKQFEYHVESKVTDPGQRLLQLLHYCRGKARIAIDECTILPPSQGYKRARCILNQLFGRPFQVSKGMINNLLNACKDVSGTADSLTNLAIRMQNCFIALNELDHQADLNASYVLESIVKALPLNLQFRWAEEADKISVNGREPLFSELAEFIMNRSRIASSRYGQLAEQNSTKSKQFSASLQNKGRDSKGVFPEAFPMMVTQTSRSTCRLCNQLHQLRFCPKFLELETAERWMTAKRLGVCYNCLNGSHLSVDCRAPTACGKNNCNRRHHVLLHRDNVALTKTDVVEAENTGICSTTQNGKKVVRLGIIPVKIETPFGLVKTLAFLDSGSDTTLVKQQFVQDYSLMNNKTSLTMTTVSGTSALPCFKGKVKIFSWDETNSIVVDEAYSVKDIPIKPTSSIKDEASKWSHLRDIQFDEFPDSEVTILLGCDVPEAHWALEQRVSNRKQPYAVKTLLGWVMYGPLSKTESATSMFIDIYSSEHSICEQLRMLYDQDFADSSETSDTLSRDDHFALQSVENRIRFVDGHFEVPIPWKPSIHVLSDNYVEARKRLEFLRRRLLRDERFCKQYKAGMCKYVEKGHLELVTSESYSGKRVWYMPHHGVFHPKKPDKIRIVFDCAAKYKGTSLNDAILSGPDLTSPLLHVLLRFRMHSIAVTADIEEMFLQVRVPVADRDALRLLWWPDTELKGEPAVYRMTVHPFGVTSSPFCANFALRKAIEKFGQRFGIDEQFVNRSFYVDDFLASLPDQQSALTLVNGVTGALAKAGFRLTKWISNSREVLRHIPQEERAANFKNLDVINFPAERTLGVQWDSNTDDFLFSSNMKERITTRRELLSTIAGLYDPLGFVAPWIMPGKILLQNLCRKKVGWDEALCDDDQKDLQSWLRIMEFVKDLRIPRCLKIISTESSQNELHLFGDASESGYGAVAYACSHFGEMRSTVLLFSKARVAPLKAVSLPRLELSAAVLAVRMYEIIKRADFATFNKVIFWTDSMIVLYYIKNTSTRFSTFVANRLAVIHDHTTESQWRFVPSSLNPADKLSRGISYSHRETDWLSGPSFLNQPEWKWPSSVVEEVNEDEIEYKRKIISVKFVSECTFWQKMWQHYSQWKSLIRAIAWLTRFKLYWILMNTRNQTSALTVGALTVTEMYSAEIQLLKTMQEQQFSEDIKYLIANGKPRRDSSLKKLNPFILDGLLRIHSRLTHANVKDDTKYPIILPSKHYITDLIISYYHEKEGHTGYAQVLASMRQRFWVIHGAGAIKRVIRSCPICRRLNATPNRQLMASLPAFRVQPGWFPFMHVGIDYFGPLLVKHGRSYEKRYGCLFTCLQSRAIHIEIVHSLSTDSFIMTLIRFIARRGSPTDIYSDNGSNFVGAQRELLNWISNLDQEVIGRRLSFKDVQWHFNPPYASHRGGVWERLIRSIRKVFSAVCVEQTINDEVLLTVMTEVERIINARPIVPAVSDDINSIALTPNDLLLLRSNNGAEFKECLLERYKSRWKQANYIAGVFWKRWTKEYITTLSLRQRWWNKERNLNEGDVVLLTSECLRRDKWPIGVISKVNIDDDGCVRTVSVKTSSGDVIRDVRHLSLLEGASRDNMQIDVAISDADNLGQQYPQH